MRSAGSSFRCAEIDNSVTVDPLSRALGFGGSSSRISRMASVISARSSRSRVSGVVPVNSSYNSTPRL